MTWEEYLQPFASAVNKSVADLTDVLKLEVGEPSEQAIEVLKSEEFTPFESLKNCLAPLNIPTAILRKSVLLLRGKQEVKVPMNTGNSILPAIPDDSSFLESLKIGGDLKVGVTEIVSAIKATIAKKLGLFDLPIRLADKMELFAETCEEPVGKDFFDVRNLVIERSYAEVMSVMGIKGSFVTEGRKTAFLTKLDASLWNETKSFYDLLVSWNQTWINTTNNPLVMFQQLSTMISGGATGASPAMIQPPDTSVLRDAAESLIATMNRIFAGYGIPIARALAYEAQRIKTIMDNDKLPAMIGAANRELMLKMLDSDITSDYVRLERNLVQFVVSIMEYPKIEAQTELLYLSEMLKLGSAIDFNKLSWTKTENKNKLKSF